jgi:hypothetical protein
MCSVTFLIVIRTSSSRGVQKTNRFRFLERREFHFFFLKRMMYVTDGGAHERSTGETSFEEGFIVMTEFL